METQTLKLPDINPHASRKEQQLAWVRWAYQPQSFAERRKRLPIATDKTGIPAKLLYKRACRLGLISPNTDIKKWTVQETEILEQYAHLSASVIAKRLAMKGFKRSTIAVENRRKRFLDGIRQARIDAGVYSAEQAAKLLGVAARSITYWISIGWLNAKRQGTARSKEKGDIYVIKSKDLRLFIINNVAKIPFDKVDKYWLVDLLSNYNADKA